MALFNLLQKREQAASGTSGRSANIRGKVTYGNSDNSALMIASVYRAVSLRADTMAQLVMEYHRKNSAGGNFTIDMGPTRGRMLNYLLQVQPNERMNWPTMMRQAEIRRVMYGNAYIYVERDMGEEVKAFWLCSNASYSYLTNTYTITYFVGNMLQTLADVPAKNVIHLRNTYSIDGGFTGISTLRYAARVFNTAATQDQISLDTAAKGGKKKLVIQEQAQQNLGLGKVASKEMEKIANKFEEDLFENDVTYVPNAAQIHDYSQSMAELQMLDSRKFSIREVARLFGVPASMLMDDSNSNYNTPENATLEFLSRTIAPLIREWECEFNAKLLDITDYDKHRFHLCEKPLFRLDRQGQAAWDKARMETGVVSINELRAEQELERIENGDDHYVSTNLAVAGSQKLNGEIEKGAAQ